VPTATPGPTAKPSSLVVRWHRSADVAAPRDSWSSWAGGGRGQTWTKFGATYVLIPRGRTLFGVGMRWTADHAIPTVWTAALPNDSVNAGPAPTPTQSPPPGGCGD
jgi:hypothetical protein